MLLDTSTALAPARRLTATITVATGGIGGLKYQLDARGKSLTSEDFAKRLAAFRDHGALAALFLIGGADGLTDEVRKDADFILAFGAATFPHQLIRILLAEQIYRAVTILSGHPYHRA